MRWNQRLKEAEKGWQAGNSGRLQRSAKLSEEDRGQKRSQMKKTRKASKRNRG